MIAPISTGRQRRRCGTSSWIAAHVPALRAHFMRMFEQVQERERREAQLPPSLTRAALTQAAEGLPAGSEGLLDSAHGSDAPSQSQLGAPEGT